MSAVTRRPLVAGNWKLHKSLAEARGFARELHRAVSATPDVEVAVAPVFTALHAVAETLAGSPVKVLAQNVYWESQGAFTGEVSAPLLKDAGADGSLVGHSERRALFGEDDAQVHRKLVALLAHGLRPILCVGETLPEREAGKTLDVVLGQLDAALHGVTGSELGPLVIAYEPVWAIGTGRNASPDDAEQVHAAIRQRLQSTHGAPLAGAVRILYGGSVKPGNAKDLMAKENVDGALVGGASLSLESFVAIVEAAR